MTTAVASETLVPVLARELAAAWSARASATITAAPGGRPSGIGWAVAVPVSGVSSGQVIAWFDAATVTAAARTMLGLEDEPADDLVADVVGTLVSRAVDAAATTPEGAGLVLGTPAARKATAPPSGAPFLLSDETGAVCQCAVLTDLAAPTATLTAASAPIESGDSRLDAVLEVELPLLVRFGRAIMPLRSVAELSPGAVVDMGRSPDEPVELLVGERLIARGEVVIVGGNYGVRITELTSGRRSTDLEARR